ncbi:MAG: chorismate synthase [Betaproteobacteria bacterium AqS2]|uniref:Chorismate synthase n=1 Tax=Candidatus Amphirhobacter heronislandensis TaxID=1732024 RepID=A0A930UH69_9GAMM|nr:chorismate synthase [Betaproteobacteria bacterium AqS2]
MAGNSFGQLFRITTFGESHGPALGVVIDGCPPGIVLDEELIRRDLRRRRPGASQAVSQRKETDDAEILAGTFEGRTTGTPLMMLIRNNDAKPGDYAEIKDRFRPGHADYSYWKKYGIRDHRGSGRASARETAARVAAGAVARMVLREIAGAEVFGCVASIGELAFALDDVAAAGDDPYFCPQAGQRDAIEAHIAALRKDGDSCGAVVHVEARGVPAGLGEPVFDRLDADIAKALMSINAVKAVEVGAGTAAAAARGSAHGDEMTGLGEFRSNNAGGVLGGISTGQDVVARMTLKPTSSITTPKDSVDVEGKPVKVATKGRHDPCVGLRAPPIAEAMLALTLADHLLRHRGQTGRA